MPPRSNPFQELVAIIQEQRAGEASVQESGMLPDGAGEPREVDVVISSRVADHDFIISVEVIARGRPATKEWVDQMLGKHADLPTNLLVLVSKSGFTPGAETRARGRAKLITPAELSDSDQKGWIVNRLKSLWTRSFRLSPNTFQVTLLTPGGETVHGQVKSDTNVHLVTDGNPYVGMIWPLIESFIGRHLDKVAENFGLATIDEDCTKTFMIALDPPAAITPDGQRLRWAVMKESTGEIFEVKRLEVWGDATIEVGAFELESFRLGNVVYAHGVGNIGPRPAILVVTEDESGGVLTIRPREVTPPGRP